MLALFCNLNNKHLQVLADESDMWFQAYSRYIDIQA